MAEETGRMFDGSKTCYPTNYDRRLLVWYKKFPNLESVPDEVSTASVRLVKQKARIHLNLAVMGIFSVVFLATALSGRKAREQGKSVAGMNMEWHRKFNESGIMGNIRDEEQGKNAELNIKR